MIKRGNWGLARMSQAVFKEEAAVALPLEREWPT